MCVECMEVDYENGSEGRMGMMVECMYLGMKKWMNVSGSS